MSQSAVALEQSSRILGMDIGGSKTSAIQIRRDPFNPSAATVSEQIRVGSANVQNVSVEEATANLAKLFAAVEAPEELEGVVAGAGGVDTEQDAKSLRELIQVHAPNAEVTVLHDSALMLYAGKTDTGISTIVGTGTASWGIDAEKNQARAGGWGYLLGDEGSAYWVGRAAVRHTLARHDQGLAVDALGAAMLDFVGVSAPSELIAAFHDRSKSRRYWASGAKIVFDLAATRDAGSVQIIKRAGDDILALVSVVMERLPGASPLIFGGGMIQHQPLLQEYVLQQLTERRAPEARILDQDPVYGVLHLARITDWQEVRLS